MKPALTEILSSARVVSLPLRTRFRGVVDREVMLFEGPNGWAEWSPFVEYPDDEAATWLTAAIELAYGSQPLILRDKIPVNATLPAVAPDQIEKTLSRFGAFGTVKIKVAEKGQDLNDDLQRLWAVRRSFPEARIRLDANGGYSVANAFAIGAAMIENGVPLDYLEQPVATIAEMVELRRKFSEAKLGIKVAADESVRKMSDPLAVVEAGAADILVLKAAPLGGISRTLEIAEAAGLPVVVSSALESSVGLSMGAHLAAALPALEFEAGLGTGSLLAGDVTRETLVPIDGSISVHRVEVDEQRLDILEAEDHRIDWWVDRLDRAFKLLD